MSPQLYMRILSLFMANLNIIANNTIKFSAADVFHHLDSATLIKITRFHFFAENAVTSIFAKGWDSLGLSKKIVNKTAKIGQKMNSLLLAKMPSL